MIDKKNKGSDHRKSKRAHKINDQPKTNRPWLILDAILFLILLLVASLSMVIISSTPGESNSFYTNYTESDEYIEYSMQMILSSTVRKVVYYDVNGSMTEIMDQTFEHLILMDLAIRTGEFGEFNSPALDQGLQNDLEYTLNAVFGMRGNFIFTAGIAVEVGVEQNSSTNIIITNLDEPPQLDDEVTPHFEKHLSSPNTVKSNFGSNQVIIRLYLI